MKFFFEKISVFIATGFGIGYLLPIGMGSLAALIALFFVGQFLGLSLLNQTLLILAGILAGAAVSFIAEKKFGKKDDHRIVIDEIVSVFITFWALEYASITVLIFGFILNRLFDIWKPFFISRLQNLRGGWGIMFDDAASAVLSNIILRFIIFIF